MAVFWLDFCFVGGLLWIPINSQSHEWGATLELVKFEILESRGYFGLGRGLLWQGATLDRSLLTVQTVYPLKVLIFELWSLVHGKHLGVTYKMATSYAGGPGSN